LIAFEGIQQRFGATAFALLAHHDFGILKFYNARKEQRNYDFFPRYQIKSIYRSIDMGPNPMQVQPVHSERNPEEGTGSGGDVVSRSGKSEAQFP
jgi:hypothetical protein